MKQCTVMERRTVQDSCLKIIHYPQLGLVEFGEAFQNASDACGLKKKK